MTVIENIPKVQYEGPYTAGDVLPLTFPYNNPEDVKLSVDNELLEYNTDYSVTGENVNILVNVPQGSTVTLYRLTPIDQQAKFPQNEKFDSEKINEALDKICMEIQEQQEAINRCVKVQMVSDTNTDEVLTQVNRLYDSVDNLDTVADSIADVNTVAGMEENISSVLDNKANIDTVAANSNAVTSVATNIVAVQNAASNAILAAQKAQEATTAAESAVTASTTATQKAQEATTAAESALNAEEQVAPLVEQAQKAAEEAVKANNQVQSKYDVWDIGTALYIDENAGLRRYLNGQIVAFANIPTASLDKLRAIQAVSPQLFTDETSWQAELALSHKGQCGKFVLDEENQTLRLPAVVNIQGVMNLANLGLRVEAAIPNPKITITDDLMHPNVTTTGPIEHTTGTVYGRGGGYVNDIALTNVTIDPSLMSNVYKDGATTVQEEAIQYPYFIQIATGAEVEANVLNTLELNNPYTLFDSKYTDVPLYNLSWLRSTGSFEPKATYLKVYEALQVEHNPEIAQGTTVQLPSGTSYTKRGLSVKLSTETYTDYDFVLNTTDETFRLKLKTGDENEIDYDNGVVISGTQLYTPTSNGVIIAFATGSGSETGVDIYYGDTTNVTSRIGTNVSSNSSGTFGSCEVRVNKGEEYNIVTYGSNYRCNFYPYKESNLLYFYVGETVQNANLINAGRIEEKLVGKVNAEQVPHLAMPSDRYIDWTLLASNSIYDAPSDGYVYLAKMNNANYQGAELKVVDDNDNIIYSISNITPPATGVPIKLLLPVKKEARVQIYYNLGGTLEYFRFIYAEGAY